MIGRKSRLPALLYLLVLLQINEYATNMVNNYIIRECVWNLGYPCMKMCSLLLVLIKKHA